MRINLKKKINGFGIIIYFNFFGMVAVVLFMHNLSMFRGLKIIFGVVMNGVLLKRGTENGTERETERKTKRNGKRNETENEMKISTENKYMKFVDTTAYKGERFVIN